MNNLPQPSVDFAQLFERDLEPAVIVDAAQRIHFVNAAFTRLFGYSREALLGQNIDDFIVPAELRAEAMELGSRSQEGREVSLETVRRTKDGRAVNVWILAAPFEATDGEPLEYVQYRDITDRVPAGEDPIRKRAEVRTTVEPAPVGIALIDLAGVVLEANAALEGTLGYARGRLAGCDMMQLVHSDQLEQIRMLQAELLKTNATVRVSCRLQKSDTSYVWTRVTASAVRSVTGEPQHIICVFEDTTDARLAAERNLALGKLAGGIAHEFNNILTSLQGHALLLLEEAELNEQGRSDVQEIVRSAHRAALLTRQLLACSRPESWPWRHPDRAPARDGGDVRPGF